ncbi:MAG: tetratricopeptide repeat protein, partial [Gemmatimonadota bacterium]|nr:tetratricopeptide repeat protein [Gemmatimonadota bacterium]
GSILLVAFINVTIAAIALYLEEGLRRGARIWLPAASSALLVAGTAVVYACGGLGPVVRFSMQDSGKEILYCKEGAQASIAVLRNFSGDRELNINGESTAYTGFEDMVIHKLLAHLPLLFHPGEPENVLVVGFGLGNTVYTATRYGLPVVECVELVPDEVLTAPYFIPENHGVLDSQGVKIIFDDGRNLILRSKAKYDVISFNAIHPKLSPMLYTLDFYRLCAGALAPGGTVCAWLPTNGLSLVELKSLLRSFIEVFPHSSLWYCNPANIILLGSSGPFRIDYNAVCRTLAEPAVRDDLREVRLDEPLSLLSLFMMGERRLRELTSDAPLNTDSRPVIEFSTVMAPTVPLESYQWMMDNLEPVTGYLSLGAGSSMVSEDSLAAVALESRIRLWSDARRLFYEGKFASWVFQEPNVAVELYSRALSMNPEDSYMRYFVEGRRFAPDSLARAAAADRSDFVVRYQLGELCYRTGRLQEAKRWFREVVHIRPDHAQAWFQLGVCLKESGNAREAERCFQRVLEIHPASPQALVNLGLIHYLRKDYTAARRCFERALRTSPNCSHALFNLGNLEIRLGHREEAIRFFRETVRHNPFKAEAYLNLGAQLTNRGDYTEAVDKYLRAIELYPSFVPAHLNLALTYGKMGDSLNAAKYETTARRLQARTQRTP